MRKRFVKLGAAVSVVGGLVSLVSVVWVGVILRYGGSNVSTLTDLLTANYAIFFGLAVSVIGIGLAFWGLVAPKPIYKEKEEEAEILAE